MIRFHYETLFKLKEESITRIWIKKVVLKNKFIVGEINYIFCSDKYLHKINKKYLNHNTYTDVVSFNYSFGKSVSGDIFISVERVKENASRFKVSFYNELFRVMAHGILHCMGFKDKVKEDQRYMKRAENLALALLNN